MWLDILTITDIIAQRAENRLSVFRSRMVDLIPNPPFGLLA